MATKDPAERARRASLRGKWEFYTGDLNYVDHGGWFLWTPSPKPEEFFFLEVSPVGGRNFDDNQPRLFVNVHYVHLDIVTWENWVSAYRHAIAGCDETCGLTPELVAWAMCTSGSAARVADYCGRPSEFRHLRARAREALLAEIVTVGRSFLGEAMNRSGDLWVDVMRGTWQWPREKRTPERRSRVPVPGLDEPMAVKMARLRGYALAYREGQRVARAALQSARISACSELKTAQERDGTVEG